MPLDARTFPTRIFRTRRAREYEHEQFGENKYDDREELYDFLDTLSTGIPPRCVFETRGRCQKLRPHPKLRFKGETIHDIGFVPMMRSQQHPSWDGAQDPSPCPVQNTHCRTYYASKDSQRLPLQEMRPEKCHAQTPRCLSLMPRHHRTRNGLPPVGIEPIQKSARSSYNVGTDPCMDPGMSGFNSQIPYQRTEDPTVPTNVSTEQQVSSREENSPSNIAQAQFSTAYVKLSPLFGQSDQSLGTHLAVADQPMHQQRTASKKSTIPKAFHLPTGSIDLTGHKGVHV